MHPRPIHGHDPSQFEQACLYLTLRPSMECRSSTAGCPAADYENAMTADEAAMMQKHKVHTGNVASTDVHAHPLAPVAQAPSASASCADLTGDTALCSTAALRSAISSDVRMSSVSSSRLHAHFMATCAHAMVDAADSMTASLTNITAPGTMHLRLM